MSTEIVLIQSKSLALRVARELHLEFMRTGLSSQVQRPFSQVLAGLGISHPNSSDLTGQAKETPEQADAALDAAELLRGLVKGCLMFVDFDHDAGSGTNDRKILKRQPQKPDE